ncbi:hypothetical protein cypCar_00002404 [Cyprinus carpio]|nr:hypothetical protein cypCar_00002404 [Cyprinus carpio]
MMQLYYSRRQKECMRDLCKEEDYTFLNSLGKQEESLEESTCLESECQEKQEERIRYRQEREQLEREKQREKEEQQKDFQKKVVLQDLGLDPGSENESVKHLMMRL